MLGTMAWYGANRGSSSNAMQLRSDTSPNMIIDDDLNDLRAVVIPNEHNFYVIFGADAAVVKPATHDSDYSRYGTGLKTVSNSSVVSVTSGAAKPGKVLSFAEAENTNDVVYYKDFTVYLASTDSELVADDLTATIAEPSSTSIDTFKAASIDFYVDSVSQANYKGTLNIAGYDAAVNDHATTKSSVELRGAGNIPYNRAASNNNIKVIMRCYFDGGLLKSNGNTFINTATITTSGIKINVMFTANHTAGN
ncbi:MAG: hypothetical protein IKR08_02810 [Firmicutes bacterium]|nr:hypothetical protein [Bacillota bacterium]